MTYSEFFAEIKGKFLEADVSNIKVYKCNETGSIVITPEDVSIYNAKHKMLRRVCQKDNIFVDVYI